MIHHFTPLRSMKSTSLRVRPIYITVRITCGAMCSCACLLITMAMKLGGKYRFRDVTAWHWEKLGEALGFRPDFVRRQVLTMNDRIVEAAVVLSGELNKNPETKSPIYERITSVINSDQT